MEYLNARWGLLSFGKCSESGDASSDSLGKMRASQGTLLLTH